MVQKVLSSDSMFRLPGGKITSDLGVAGAVDSAKPVAIGTVGTA